MSLIAVCTPRYMLAPQFVRLTIRYLFEQQFCLVGQLFLLVVGGERIVDVRDEETTQLQRRLQGKLAATGIRQTEWANEGKWRVRL
jgi:hypothetical protein